MSKNPKNFEELRELVDSRFEPFAQIPLMYLNEEGLFRYDVYDTLEDAFFEVGTLEEYVESVRWEIEQLLKHTWYRSVEGENRDKRIAAKLRSFIRIHVANELWENIPEFANRKEN